MKTVTLYIETPDGGQQTLTLGDEISIGRTSSAQLVLSDQSLSRLHATIFREGEDVWILDENSSNGTFVGGERIAPERKLKDGDEILLGSHTRIYVEIIESRELKAIGQKPQVEKAADGEMIPPQIITDNKSSSPPPLAKQKKPLPVVPILAGAGSVFIIIFAIAAIFVARSWDKNQSKTVVKATPQPIRASAVIPIRVIDPLGGEDPDDLEDFISSWEGVEVELQAENIEEIKTMSSNGDSKQPTDLVVKVDFWKEQRDKALNHAGVNEPLNPPPQMSGRGFVLQMAKTGELIKSGAYKQPLDFADLAELYLKGTLVELPIATNTYVLDVGGSATGDPFMAFDFDRGGTVPIEPGSEKDNNLKRLAEKLKYDLSNPQHRKQMRMRLLRMYNAKSRELFEELCNAYYQRFKVPLRITSLTRSMDYQISLNQINGNSFRVKSKGSLPPHTSGCAFDMSRKNLSTGEQNFIMAKLAELEIGGKLDSLMEGNANACFHTFIYPDGVGPGHSAPSQPKPAVSQPLKQSLKSGK